MVQNFLKIWWHNYCFWTVNLFHFVATNHPFKMMHHGSYMRLLHFHSHAMTMFLDKKKTLHKDEIISDKACLWPSSCPPIAMDHPHLWHIWERSGKESYQEYQSKLHPLWSTRGIGWLRNSLNKLDVHKL